MSKAKDLLELLSVHTFDITLYAPEKQGVSIETREEPD